MSKTERYIFSERYMSIVQGMRHRLWQRYPQVTDPADRDNVFDVIQRRLAEHEEKYGTAQNLPAMIRKIFPQVVANLLRRGYYRVPTVSIEDFERTGSTRETGLSAEGRITAKDLLDLLDERSREIVYRRIMSGEEPNEIASALGITPGYVRVICHRAIERLRRIR